MLPAPAPGLYNAWVMIFVAVRLEALLGLPSILGGNTEDGNAESVDQNGELQALRQWLDEVKGSRPMTEREKLEQELDEAVAKEDYERAAEVRDALKCLAE